MKNIMPMLGGVLLTVLYFTYSGKICFQLNLANYSRDYIIYLIVLFLVFLAITPILLPIHRYNKYGKNNRINDVTGFFDVDLIADYFDQFFRGDDNCRETAETYRKNPTYKNKKALKDVFDTTIRDTFGRDRIKYATYVLLIVSFVVLFFAIEGGVQLARELGGITDSKPVHFPLGLRPDITSLAAIFGAYTWITSDAIYRYRRNDFNSSDVLWYSLRLIVAIPLGEAVAAFAPMQTAEGKAVPVSSAGPLLAFVISMFSFSSIQQMLGAFINRAYNLPTTAADARDDALIKLPGIDQTVADRLGAEGITTMAQLVATDPVLLCSHTAIPFCCILDYVNSAMLWKLVGAKLLILREFGWQGTSQVIAFSERNMPSLIDNINTFNKAKLELEEAQTEVFNAKQTCGDSENEAIKNAQISFNKAKEKFDSALIQVKNGGKSDESIFVDMAKKAEMAESAFPEIINQIIIDSYAQFIYKIKIACGK